MLNQVADSELVGHCTVACDKQSDTGAALLDIVFLQEPTQVRSWRFFRTLPGEWTEKKHSVGAETCSERGSGPMDPTELYLASVLPEVSF